MLRSIYRFFFGNDFFISYARKDSTGYALSLANSILDNGFTCYLDQFGTQAGGEIPLSLKIKIKASKIFLLVCSACSLSSDSINKEIIEIDTTYTDIIPIVFSDISSAIWHNQIYGIAVSSETIESLLLGKPSENIINRIINAFNYKKQTNRIKLFLKLSVTAVSILFVTLLYLANNIESKSKELSIATNKINYSNSIISDLEKKRNSLESINKQKTEELNTLGSTINIMKNESLILKNKIGIMRKNILIQKNQIIYYSSLLELQQNEYRLLQSYFENSAQSLYEQPILLCEYINIKDDKPIKIYILSDRVEITKQTMIVLDEFIKCWLSSNNKPNILIRGYLSSLTIVEDEDNKYFNNNHAIRKITSPSSEYALALGDRSAYAIKEYLISKGIPNSNIVTMSMGKEGYRYELEFLNNRCEISTLP